MIDNTIKLVVGSWKAYTENNERAMGSKLLDLSEFQSKEEIIQELKEEGFTSQELEELFIQDYEGNIDISSYDNVNPLNLFEWLKEANYFDDENKADQIIVHSHENVTYVFLNDLEKDDIPDYQIYNCDKVEYTQQRFEESGYNIPDWVMNYIDFEQMADDDYDLNEISIDGECYTYLCY